MNDAVEIAFLNAAGAMAPADFAFACAAIQAQLTRDFLPIWGNFLAVKKEYVVVGYTSAVDLAPGSFDPIEVLPALDDPNTLGDHGGIAVTGMAFGRALPIPTVMSHEGLELPGDPYGDRWVKLPSGIITALEMCDAVESDTYLIPATVGTETRDVSVSNFLTPAWFGEGGGTSYDFLGLCREPGENRGYMIVANDDGTTTNVFADRAYAGTRIRVAAKMMRPGSRTAKRAASRARVMFHFR